MLDPSRMLQMEKIPLNTCKWGLVEWRRLNCMDTYPILIYLALSGRLLVADALRPAAGLLDVVRSIGPSRWAAGPPTARPLKSIQIA